MDILLTRIYNGEEKALHLLRDEWSSKLNLFAYSYVRCNFVAEDLVQDTFLKLWETREDAIKYENIGSLVFTILKNKCIDYLKHKTIVLKHSKYCTEEYNYLLANKYALEDKSINIITDSQIRKALIKAIKQLPRPCRDVFIMSRFKELKNTEIAKELSLSVKTVEYHMTRAISQLRKNLENYYLLLYFLFSD